MNPVIRTTVLISILLHLIAYLWYAKTAVFVVSPPKQNSITQEITLLPPIQKEKATEAPEPEPIKPPAPRHMEDDITKANSSDGLADKGSKTKVRQQKQATGDSSNNAMAKESINSKQSDVVINNHTLEQQSSSLANSQTMEALDEEALDDSIVESPLTELEEEKAKWRNEVLARLNKQVYAAWAKPFNSSSKHKGVLKMEIGSDGYLKNAWVRIPSGDPNLDASILKAVKSVWRFQVPNSQLMNRYYRHLEFHYQGG